MENENEIHSKFLLSALRVKRLFAGVTEAARKLQNELFLKIIAGMLAK